MQESMERRGPEARVPLDLFVRLSHEDFDETFDADGVDLGRGGLALRSDFLPEVGDRLSCRFETPLDNGALELDGEVVWAHDAGDRSGQFGLRFRDLDASREHDLFRLVEHLAGEEKRRTTRLHLDGVSTPIEGRVVASSEAWIRIEQELPFLQLGMGISIEGDASSSRGTLSSVDLRIEEGTPRLILGVSFDANRPSTLDEHDVSTVEGLSARAPVTRDDPSVARPAEESTLMDYELPLVLRDDLSDEEMDADDPLDMEVAALLDGVPGGDPFADDRDDHDADFEAAELLAAHERETRGVFTVDDDADDDGAERSVDVQPNAVPAAVRARAIAMRIGAISAAFASNQVWPFLSKLKGMLATFFAALVARGGPGAKRLASQIGAFAKTGLTKIGSRIGKATKKRRTTAPVPRRVAGAPRKRRGVVEVEEVVPKKRGRIVLLSAVAFLGVAGGVYALTSADEVAAAPTTVPVITPEAAPAPAEPAFAEAPPVYAVIAEPAAPIEAAERAIDPEAGDVMPPEPIVEEEAPAPVGGRLDEPSYPTLRDATDRAPGPVSEGRRFGAESVPNGRSATIQMSEPVTVLSGQATEDGFSVTIPGSLARDRAGPIAAANPQVDRATILNRGDHAVLTVTFAAGRHPAYQVIARERAIEVIIER